MSLRKEIRRLQQRVGVTADGIVGPVTVAAMHAELDRLTLPFDEVKVFPATKAKFFEFDARTERNLKTLRDEVEGRFREFTAEAQALAAVRGVDYVAISGLRTYADQDALYAKGRTKPGPRVTNARGGFSNHNFGDALDFGVFRNGRYLDGSSSPKEKKEAMAMHKAAAELAEKHGLEWGGNWRRFKDYPHFEDAGGLSLKEKRAKVNRGEWKF